MNGSQTSALTYTLRRTFEYGVILNGSQTVLELIEYLIPFEYGVILNGSQTAPLRASAVSGLSMVLF